MFNTPDKMTTEQKQKFYEKQQSYFIEMAMTNAYLAMHHECHTEVIPGYRLKMDVLFEKYLAASADYCARIGTGLIYIANDEIAVVYAVLNS